jgi:hypothetical protein
MPKVYPKIALAAVLGGVPQGCFARDADWSIMKKTKQ